MATNSDEHPALEVFRTVELYGMIGSHCDVFTLHQVTQALGIDEHHFHDVLIRRFRTATKAWFSHSELFRRALRSSHGAIFGSVALVFLLGEDWWPLSQPHDLDICVPEGEQCQKLVCWIESQGYEAQKIDQAHAMDMTGLRLGEQILARSVRRFEYRSESPSGERQPPRIIDLVETAGHILLPVIASNHTCVMNALWADAFVSLYPKLTIDGYTHFIHRPPRQSRLLRTRYRAYGFEELEGTDEYLLADGVRDSSDELSLTVVFGLGTGSPPSPITWKIVSPMMAAGLTSSGTNASCVVVGPLAHSDQPYVDRGHVEGLVL